MGIACGACSDRCGEVGDGGMTREEAIKVLEEDHKQRVDGYTSYLAHYGHTDHAEEQYLDAMELAISALREQEERSNGCRFCKAYESLLKRGADLVKFCPMCGRKLEVE